MCRCGNSVIYFSNINSYVFMPTIYFCFSASISSVYRITTVMNILRSLFYWQLAKEQKVLDLCENVIRNVRFQFCFLIIILFCDLINKFCYSHNLVSIYFTMSVLNTLRESAYSRFSETNIFSFSDYR